MTEKHPKLVRAEELRNQAAVLEGHVGERPEHGKLGHNDRHAEHERARIAHLRSEADRLEKEAGEETEAVEHEAARREADDRAAAAALKNGKPKGKPPVPVAEGDE